MDNDILETSKTDDVIPEINTEKACYLGCYIDDELAGVSIFKPENYMCVEYHPNLLKKFRGETSKPYTVNSLKWLVENAPQYTKVNVKFPKSIKGLDKYAESCGFTFEGVDRQSHPTGDRLCYGITKQEIELL